VAYIKECKPVKGRPEFNVLYKGVNWFFALKTNADLFEQHPKNMSRNMVVIAPLGCSRGYKAKTYPDAWTIIGDKLYLNYNSHLRNEWNKDQQGYIEKADSNWPEVKNKKYP